MLQDNFQLDAIREAFIYRNRFAGRTMVFKIDFPITEDPAFPFLMRDLALVAKASCRVVIVPGAKEWIDAVLKEYGIVSEYAGENRITTGAAIRFVEMAAFHAATRFMTGLSADRVDAVIGNFVRARGLGVVNGADMEHTGRVDKIFTESITRILDQGMIPILPCIGWSPAGRPYNVPGDEIALAAASALGAVKLFIVSAHAGIRQENYRIPAGISVDGTGRIGKLTPQETEAVLAENRVPEGGDLYTDKPLSDLRMALRASRAGVDRVHLIDGRESGALLRELFSNRGAGIMIYRDEYESIRSLKTQDIPDILRIMEPLMVRGALIRRNSEDIQDTKKDYVVFEIDGSIHACGALHDWGEGQGEIAAIATDAVYADMGLGRRIVNYLIDRAGKQGLRRVFVLTTGTHDWFESLGFTESPVESLP
ncbi:MAG: amino-acid N-acetyltransferase, partial [Treponema sp.]|nr:amino-acid N-acetyltransferase [Treponema sp.]